LVGPGGLEPPTARL